MSKRFLEVDDLTRPNHAYLTNEDRCFYYGEYTTGGGYTHGETNSLILNFKKSMDRKIRPDEWRHKESAIVKAARIFRSAFVPNAFSQLTFVPVPPSKAKSDPLYDDRMVRMLNVMCDGIVGDVRELVIQVQSMDPSHGSSEGRPNSDQIAANYVLDRRLLEPQPKTIIVCDDVLTTGAHFKAAQKVLKLEYPQIPIYGFFIARRVPRPAAWDFQ